MQDPILILQMQRMGDLVLAFPLMLWLRKQHPEAPLWVVGERAFFEGLLPLSPPATYVSWDALDRLRNQRFRLLVNLSHRTEAAQLAAQLDADEVLGPVKHDDAPVHIRGAWQLYRTNLVHNNRHNQFHWAELNALDIVPRKTLATTRWPAPTPPAGKRVGLFLGASQEEKRPTVAFWGRLVKELTRRGLTPVLLGGPEEVALGRKVKAHSSMPAVNLCGRFTLPQFVSGLGELDLLVTPDTGPMHLAAWIGLPCLNLSMGPVNPWETGPYQPGHYVLQAAMSCVNCWHCTHPEPYRCRRVFSPQRTAFLVQRLMTHREAGLDRLDMAGMRLLRTSRNELGLYHLQRLGQAAPTLREHADTFWSRYFAMLFGLVQEPAARSAWETLQTSNPALVRPLAAGVQQLGQGLSRSLHKGSELEESFWKGSPPLLRPLTGYLHLLLQNHDYGPEGTRQALACLERLAALWR